MGKATKGIIIFGIALVIAGYLIGNFYLSSAFDARISSLQQQLASYELRKDKLTQQQTAIETAQAQIQQQLAAKAAGNVPPATADVVTPTQPTAQDAAAQQAAQDAAALAAQQQAAAQDAADQAAAIAAQQAADQRAAAIAAAAAVPRRTRAS